MNCMHSSKYVLTDGLDMAAQKQTQLVRKFDDWNWSLPCRNILCKPGWKVPVGPLQALE